MFKINLRNLNAGACLSIISIPYSLSIIYLINQNSGYYKLHTRIGILSNIFGILISYLFSFGSIFVKFFTSKYN